MDIPPSIHEGGGWNKSYSNVNQIIEELKRTYSMKIMDGSASIHIQASKIATAQKQYMIDARLGVMVEGG